MDIKKIKEKHKENTMGGQFGVSESDVDNLIETVELQQLTIQLLTTILENCEEVAKNNGELNVAEYIQEFKTNTINAVKVREENLLQWSVSETKI